MHVSAPPPMTPRLRRKGIPTPLATALWEKEYSAMAASPATAPASPESQVSVCAKRRSPMRSVESCWANNARLVARRKPPSSTGI